MYGKNFLNNIFFQYTYSYTHTKTHTHHTRVDIHLLKTMQKLENIS